MLVALSLPVAYFLMQHEHEAAVLQARADMYADLFTKGLRNSTEAKRTNNRKQLATLASEVAFDENSSVPEIRRIINANDEVITEVQDALDEPFITRSADVTVSNIPIARVELSHSLWPLLTETILIGMLGLIMGFGVFRLLRIYPLHALGLADQELTMRRHAEGELQKSLSLLGATLESTADGILVLNGYGRVISYNDRFMELWQVQEINNQILDSNQVFSTISMSIAEPQKFLERLRQLKEAPSIEDAHEVLELLDGRAFELTSKPQWIDGRNVGWVLSFHDISERRRHEELLAGEKQVLQMILKGVPAEEIFAMLARNIEKQARHMFCAILMPNKDGSLRHVGGSSLAKTLITTSERARALPTLGLLQQEGGNSAEVLGNPRWGEYQRLAADHGLQLQWVVPICSSSDKVLGAVAAYYRLGFTPDRGDLKLLEIATDLGKIVLERKQAEARLDYLAHFDALTGLPNRALFHDRLTHAIDRAERSKELIGVMLLDLDRFKTINDTLGHAVGDQLLKGVAKRLQSCMRDQDTVARLGGDEFTIVLEGLATPEDAGLVAKKIIEALVPPFQLGESEVYVTPSIGVSIFPLDSDDIDDLLKHSDTAMYSAKEAGRNAFQFFTQALNTKTQGRLAMESELRHALDRGEFTLYYQPKVNLLSGEAVGVEALIRWEHPERGLVPPNDFIPLLEETGLINAVGQWLLRTTTSQARRWMDDGLPPMQIAVNISARQFLHNDLIADVIGALEESGLESDYLELEVTESMLMHNPEHTAQVLKKIQALGVVRINLDDFGTGYSSLSYLKRFPIDTVKIDASFVRDIPDDKEDCAIVLAVIAMAHSLGLKVIAEGVENDRQLAFLREKGCDEIQGYLFSPPLPAEAFERWLREHISLYGEHQSIEPVKPAKKRPAAKRPSLKAAAS